MGRLVVVFGPNESGKSTFFNFAQSMIYGFSPAARSTHPYTPWSGADIEGRIEGHLDSGDPFEVRRRLRSSPWGRLRVADDELELRNRAVPFVEHVPAAVFRKMFALTLDELSALDRETWGTLQDRLLASMVLDDLVPAKQVAEALRADARALWRPDNRGQPRDRKITAQIKELQSTRRVAADRDAELRGNQARLETSRAEYAELRTQRDALTAGLRGLERLVPANRRLRRLREAREQQHQAGTTSDLPDNPAELIERLESDLSRFEREAHRLSTRRQALREEMERFTTRDRGLVELGGTLRDHKVSFEAIPGAEARLEAANDALTAAQTRVTDAANALFETGSESLDPIGRLAEVPLDAVEEGILRASGPDSGPATIAAPDTDSIAPALVAMISGAVLLLGASARGGIVLAAFGGALLFLAMLWLGLVWDRRRRGAGPGGIAEAERRAFDEARLGAVADVRSLLAPLPLREALLDDPQPALVTHLRDALNLSHALKARESTLKERADELEALRAVTDPLLEAAGFERSEGALALFRALDTAQGRLRGHGDAQLALRDVDKQHSDLEDERRGARSTLDRLQARISEIGNGSLDRGFEALEDWRSAARRAQDLERDLRRDLGEPEDVAAEIIDFHDAHPGWPLESATVDSARAELEEITGRSEAEGGLVQRLEGEARHLEGGDTPSEIDGRIAALAEERARLRRDRDRLEMLGLVVEEAERRFKEHHQPDVLERSAAYLSRITNGRYRRLLPAHEGKDGVLSLETAAGRPVGLGEALSRGTKEQVLLSLRLAAADHMDHGGERLPLFVDEVFVNWDRGRRDRGLELLRQLSAERQVFVFTCHADVAERLASLGSRVFELPIT